MKFQLSLGSTGDNLHVWKKPVHAFGIRVPVLELPHIPNTKVLATEFTGTNTNELEVYAVSRYDHIWVRRIQQAHGRVQRTQERGINYGI